MQMGTSQMIAMYHTWCTRNHLGNRMTVFLHYSGRRGRDRMVVRFTTNYGISANHYSIQHYMIKFVCDLRQFGGFLRVLWFASPVKINAMI
jgi:hypothetical protein